jgi:uncharacterized protein YciI
MRSLALIAPGPAWTDGRPVFDQDPRVLGEHLDHMRHLFDSGALLLGGPAHDGRSGIALLDTARFEQATALVDADPAVRAGLFQFDLQRLTPYFDAFPAPRAADESLPEPHDGPRARVQVTA